MLDRFAACVRSLPTAPGAVVRICADRPFVDAALVGDLLVRFEAAGRPAYLSNTLVKSYPDGLDVEVVRTDVLLEAAAAATDPAEREHVTPYVYRRPERFELVNVACAEGDLSGVRATIDTRRDYERLRAVDARLRAAVGRYDHHDVLALARDHPDVFA